MLRWIPSASGSLDAFNPPGGAAGNCKVCASRRAMANPVVSRIAVKANSKPIFERMLFSLAVCAPGGHAIVRTLAQIAAERFAVADYPAHTWPAASNFPQQMRRADLRRIHGW